MSVLPNEITHIRRNNTAAPALYHTCIPQPTVQQRVQFTPRYVANEHAMQVGEQERGVSTARSADDALAMQALLQIMGSVHVSEGGEDEDSGDSDGALDCFHSADQVARLPPSTRAKLAGRIAAGLSAFSSRGGRRTPTSSRQSSQPRLSQPSSRSHSAISVASDPTSSAGGSTRTGGSGAGSGNGGSGHGSTGSSRSAGARARTRERDVTCVVTGDHYGVECCHILAHSLASLPNSLSFLSLLHVFAGPSRVHAVQQLLGPGLAHLDRPLNCLLLAPTVHMLFDAGRLALLPRLDLAVATLDNGPHNDDCGHSHDDRVASSYIHDRTVSYFVQVLRLDADRSAAPLVNMRPFMHEQLYNSPLIMPTASADDYNSRATPSISPVAHLITSGALIHLQTGNPATHPLPHPLLLNIHYALSCVLAAKAAAEVREDEDTHDNNDMERAENFESLTPGDDDPHGDSYDSDLTCVGRITAEGPVHPSSAAPTMHLPPSTKVFVDPSAVEGNVPKSLAKSVTRDLRRAIVSFMTFGRKGKSKSGTD